ncbi:MAG: hypothetical protein J4F35_21250 [Candidatus Latescibacteria bacterium]|nr:hypothetical protein [Candidatus Latescibacterota bacterium]
MPISTQNTEHLSFRARVPVFDANIGVGHCHDRPSPFADVAGLRAEMQRHGVERGLIYHLQGETISAIEGNEALRDWQSNGLVPQWVAGPSADSLAQLRELHAAGEVSSVRLHNTEASRVPFADWIYGELLAWLAAEHIPLWISLADTPVAEVMETLRRFPDLQAVLLGAHYVHSLALRPLLRALPQAAIELSRFENLGGIEALIGEFGIERFLYGSYYPRYAMGPILFYLHHLGIDDDALAALTAGNLERILGGTA